MIVEMPWSRVVLAAAVGLMCGRVSGADDEIGKILRPADHSSFESGQVDVVATAPGGKLQLDGALLQVDQPFGDVFHTTLKLPPGMHMLILSWEGGRKEVQFFVGMNPPTSFQPFHQHPPLSDEQCTQCHGLNKRGRFIFKRGCFDCRQRDGFGKCHNAHGSVVKAHLLYPKETACKICHD